MYVAIRLYDGVKRPDEAAAKVRNEFLPIISKISGFLEYFAVKSGDDKVTSISVFRDKPSADESVTAATKWVQSHMREYLPNPPKMIGGVTVAHMITEMAKAPA